MRSKTNTVSSAFYRVSDLPRKLFCRRKSVWNLFDDFFLFLNDFVFHDDRFIVHLFVDEPGRIDGGQSASEGAASAEPVQLLDPAAAAEMRARYGIDPTRFSLILVGKDGGEKRRESAATAPALVFGQIDQMPMRQREMKEEAEGSDN